MTDPGAVARGDTGPPGRQQALDYPTQFVILSSSEILSDVAAEVKKTFPDFNEGMLRQGLTVGQCCTSASLTDMTGGDPTKIIEVNYQGADPDEVLQVLNATADRFLKYSLEERKSSISEAVKFIDNQLPELEQRVNVLQEEMQKLQQQYLVTDPTTKGGEISKNLTDTTSLQLETNRTLSEQKTLYDNIRRQLGLTPEQAIAASTLSEDPGYQNLLRQRETVETQIATESGRFSQSSPTIQILKKQRDELVALQQQFALNVLGGDAQSVGDPQDLPYQNSVRLALIQQMVDARNQIEMLQARSNQLAQTQNLFDQQAHQFPAVARRFNELERQLALATQTLDRLLSQRETLKVEAAQNEFPWELISRPHISSDQNGMPMPVAKDVSKSMGLGLVSGLLLGMAAAMLLEKLRDVFFSPEDIQDAFHLPILATVPPCDSAYQLSHYPENLQLAKAESSIKAQERAFFESFKSLFTRLQFLYANPAASVISVCSAARGDGKSTVAFQLARSAVDAGRRVLLVDANFDAPSLHTMAGVTNSVGLSNLLTNQLPLNQVVQPSSISENLSVLVAGSDIQNAAGLLASEQMATLTQQLRQTYDLVIFDTPALQDTSDANFLSANTDGIVMVVGLGKTKRSLATQVVDEFNTFRLPCLGVVVNCIKGVRIEQPSSFNPSSTSGVIGTVPPMRA